MTVTGIFYGFRAPDLCAVNGKDLHSGELTLEELTAWVRRLSGDVERLEKAFAAVGDGPGCMSDPLLDSATVCQFLSMSYRQLKTYKQRGQIVPLYNGTKCLYPTSEVRRFVQEVLKEKGHKLKTNILKLEKDYGNE